MVGGRHKAARPVVVSRRVGNNRTSFKPRSSSYSHISIQAAPDETSDQDDGDDGCDDFIRKDSIQIQIAEQLLYQSKLAPTTSPTSPTKPLTFAEAAMSTRRRSSMKDENGEATLSGPMSLDQLGTFKYVKKKKKASKWTPFDLAAETDVTSETENNSELGQPSCDASPTPSPAKSTTGRQTRRHKHQESADLSSVSGDQPHQHQQSAGFRFGSNYPTITTPHRQEDGKFEDRSEVDSDPTPKAIQGPFPQTTKGYDGYEIEGLEVPSRGKSDSQSTKDRTEAAMSQITRAFGGIMNNDDGGDAFDSLDWDPELESALDQSPKPITVDPVKPITYTTVGSRVDPDVVPQFTAPNRIQRESAGRRPLMPYPNRGHFDYYANRDPPPPLNMQNSMHYTQQLARPQWSYGNNRITAPYPFRFQTAEPENQWVARREGEGGQTNLDENVRTPPSTRLDFSNNAENTAGKFEDVKTHDQYNGRQRAGVKHPQPSELAPCDQEDGRPFNNAPFPLQGLQNMQTLQRLARFENPQQNNARIRLSEFSVTNYQNDEPPPTNPTSALEALLRNRQLNSSNGVIGRNSNPPKPGELNLAYQFPSLGTNGAANVQTKPYANLQSDSSSLAPSTSHAPICTFIPGYPQPIKAGPPGQRPWHNLQANTRSTCNLDQFVRQPMHPATPSSAVNNAPTADPPSTDEHHATVRQVMTELNYSSADQVLPNPFLRWVHHKPRDTISADESIKYYPNGIPSTRVTEHTPLSIETQKTMGFHPDDPPFPTKEEKQAKNAKELNDRFYSGQRKWGFSVMTKEQEKQIAERLARPKGPPINSAASWRAQATAQEEDIQERLDEGDSEQIDVVFSYPRHPLRDANPTAAEKTEMDEQRLNSRLSSEERDMREMLVNGMHWKDAPLWFDYRGKVIVNRKKEELLYKQARLQAKNTLKAKLDLDKMTPAEIAAPLRDATLANILEFLDSGPGSRKELSKLGKPAEFFLDHSEEGNNSLYGEDWGAPPKKLGHALHLESLDNRIYM